jgi:hypothetical protein
LPTTYIDWTSGSPTTEFYLQCDRIGQSIAGNYTTLGVHIGAINRGNSSSFSNAAGSQTASIDGIGTVGVHSGNPFLPSGVGSGVLRWDNYFTINIPHNSDGTHGAITLRQTLSYLGVSRADTATFNDFPTIPRGPLVKNADGTWHTTTLYVKNADGTWHVATPYVKNVDGTWHVA